MKPVLSKIPTRWLLVLAALMVLIGAALTVHSLLREYQLIVDGQSMQVKAVAFTPSQLLSRVGYEPAEQDRISPAADHFQLFLNGTVRLVRARPVVISTPQGEIKLMSTERIPANLLAEAGLRLFPQDRVLWNGEPINPAKALPAGQALVLQFVPARQLALQLDGQPQLIYTQAHTLGQALAQAGIAPAAEDALSVAPDTWLEDGQTVTLERARPVTVIASSGNVQGLSSGRTVAEALADLGLLPQNLDRTIPAEDEPLPEDGTVQLIRSSEDIILTVEETAYSNTYQEDPNAELDTISVLVPGQKGYVVTRSRVRIENGAEISRQTEGPWKASDPVDGVLGRGSKVVIRTEVVDGETIEYWRKVSVYATSYHPSEFTNGAITRSGLPLTRGIIAVSAAWYPGMEFQPVFVPGYGRAIIADSGGGFSDRYWIDLGYDDENYIGWHSWTTLYFLTPVPAYIPLVLP